MVDRLYEPDTVQCPYPYYGHLRAHDPVHRLEDEDVYLSLIHI